MITALWLAVMSVLVYREFAPSWRASRAPAASASPILPTPEVHKRMGVFVGDKRVGYCDEVWTESAGAVTVRSTMCVDLMSMTSAFPVPADAHTGGDAMTAVLESSTVMRNGLVRRMNMTCRLADSVVAEMQGVVYRDQLALTIRRGDRAEHRVLRINPEYPLMIANTPSGKLKHLTEGDSWRMSALNPATFTLTQTRARVTHSECLELDGGPRLAHVVEYDYGVYKTLLWVDAQGEILKERLLGFTCVREPVPDAEISAGHGGV